MPSRRTLKFLEQVKQKLKYEWENHKHSNFIFLAGALMSLLFIVTASQAYKQDYVLPEPTQTFLIFVLAAYTLFQIYTRMSNQVREKECQDAR
jgi:predicted membrane channel-forming protein YqfA (hemolysin III family)